MALITTRVAAASMLPLRSTTTYVNFPIPPRVVLRSTDPQSKWIWAIPGLKHGDVFTSIALNAARADDQGTYDVIMTVLQADAVGSTELVGTSLSSTSSGGIAKLDTLAFHPVPPPVDLGSFMYFVHLALKNSSAAPDITDLVVPWFEYTIHR